MKKKKKKTVGSSAGGLIHVIFMEHGPQVCRDFFNDCQTVVNYWLLQHGFSVGIGDTVADNQTMERLMIQLLLPRMVYVKLLFKHVRIS